MNEPEHLVGFPAMLSETPEMTAIIDQVIDLYKQIPYGDLIYERALVGEEAVAEMGRRCQELIDQLAPFPGGALQCQKWSTILADHTRPWKLKPDADDEEVLWCWNQWRDAMGVLDQRLQNERPRRDDPDREAAWAAWRQRDDALNEMADNPPWLSTDAQRLLDPVHYPQLP